jgi:hypothetical protein
MRGGARWFAILALASMTGSIGIVTPTSAQIAAVPRPPQFLLLSYDNDSDFQVIDQLRGIAQRDHAKVTFFMSGVFMYDWEHRNLYQPPDRAAGSSSVGFQISRGGLTPPATVAATVASLRAAQTEGDELGVHFMGHFCGPGGVNTWTQSNWTAEIAQWNRATSQVDSLMGLNTGGGPLLHAPLGGRTPCLEGDPNAYIPAYAAAGYNYDSSSVRALNQWPSKQNGVWRFGIPSIATLDGRPSVLAADYNFWVRYGDEGSQAREDMIYQSLLNAFEADYNGNRAPFEAVAHTTVLMGGAFYRAEDRLLAKECGRPEVRCGTYSDAVQWLDGHAAELPALQAGLFFGPVTSVQSGVAGASAALVNVAMVGGSAAGYITADKCSRLAPGPQSFSNGNYPAGGTAVSNVAVVPVDTDGSLCVYSQTSTNLVVDVQGSFAVGGQLGFTASSPSRVLDTRSVGRVAAGSITRVASGSIGAQAALVNVAMTDASAAGYVTADRCSRLVPGPQSFSNGNYAVGGGAVSNLSVVPVDVDGSFCVLLVVACSVGGRRAGFVRHDRCLEVRSGRPEARARHPPIAVLSAAVRAPTS